MKRVLQSLVRLMSPAPLFPEAHNGLHEAFRLRRKEHGRGRGSFRRRLRRGVGSWQQIRAFLLPWAIGLMILVTVSNWNLWTFGGLLFLVIVSFLLRSEGGQVEGVMPSTLTSLLMNAPNHRFAMVDIWMTGAGGRALAHAVYCETRQSDRAASLGALVVAYLGGLAGYLVFRGFPFPEAPLLMLSAFGMFVAVAYASGTGHGYRGLREIERKWRREMEGAEYIAKAAFKAILMGVLVVIGLFLVGILIAMLLALLERLPSSVRDLPWEYHVSMAMLAVAGLLRVASAVVRRYNQERIRQTAFAIEDLYNYYMRFMIVADPEYR